MNVCRMLWKVCQTVTAGLKVYGMGRDEKEFESVGTHLPHDEKKYFWYLRNDCKFLTVNSMQ